MSTRRAKLNEALEEAESAAAAHLSKYPVYMPAVTAGKFDSKAKSLCVTLQIQCSDGWNFPSECLSGFESGALLESIEWVMEDINVRVVPDDFGYKGTFKLVLI